MIFSSICNDGWLVGILLVLLLYLIYWYRRPNNFPPGPRGVPLLGYVSIFDKPEKKIYELSKKYGSIMSVRIGSKDIVFLNDYEAIIQGLVKRGNVFSGRPRFADIEEIKKGFGIAFVDYGDLWRSQRKFGLMTLRGFGVGKKGMENICLEELCYLNKTIQSKQGKPFDMSLALHNAVSNNMCNVAFGKRFNYEDKQFVNLLNIVIHSFDDPLISFSNKVVAFSPNAKYIPPFSLGVKRLLNNIQFLFDWVDEIAKDHEKTFDEHNLRDFIDAFIAEKRKGSDSSFTDVQLQNYLHELFVAGTGTTSNTLYWALLCLLHYPETQRKLRREILNVIGASGTASYSKKSEMPYTNAFVQELFRFRTLTPIGVPHKTNEDTELCGYFIPKETQIQPNLWAVHNDPNLWKEPGKFMPERFLDEKGNFVSSNYVIPFSVGPRHCLGEQLARMEVFIFLVGMVQKFEFLPDPNQSQLPDIENGALGFVFAPLPYKLIAVEY